MKKWTVYLTGLKESTQGHRAQEFGKDGLAQFWHSHGISFGELANPFLAYKKNVIGSS